MDIIDVVDIFTPNSKYSHIKDITLANDEVIKGIPYEKDVDIVFEYIDSDLKSNIILPEYTHEYINALVNSVSYKDENGKSVYYKHKKVFKEEDSRVVLISDKIDFLNSKEKPMLNRVWFGEKLRILRCNGFKTFTDVNKHIMYMTSRTNKKPTIDDLIENIQLFKTKMFASCSAEIGSSLNIKYFKKLMPFELITHDTKNNNLYFTCYYTMEEHVVKFITDKLSVGSDSDSDSDSKKSGAKVLKEYESESDSKEQKIPDEYDNLSDAQINAIYNALNNEISIINGGPGTGKSTIIKIITEMNSANRKKTIVTAFTGKSIHRLIESGCDPATTRTMDSLIVSPIEYIDHVIIDECSMISLDLFFRFIVRYPDCKFTFVGDIDQLPPIGIGFVFKALLSIENIPLVTLNINYRSNVNTKKWFDAISFKHSDLTIRQAVNKFIDEKFDICISPLNKIVDEFNDLVRIKLGRTGKWYKGDTVISCVNIQGDKRTGSKGILNGLSGKVIDVQGTYLFVQFEGSHEAHKFKILNKSQEIQQSIADEEFNLKADEETIATKQIESSRLHTGMLKYGYAITVHKSQGSEYNKVLIVTGSNFWNKFYTRNLLFTAVTRYKKEVFVAGPVRLIQQTVQNKLAIPMDTFLKKMERIQTTQKHD